MKATNISLLMLILKCSISDLVGCWVEYRTLGNKKYELAAYELMSANDAPERDPMDWYGHIRTYG